jgi:microcystin-dependent protein
MSDTSPKWGIVEPVAARTDAADVPLYVRNIVAALEAKGVQYGQGTLAARPTAAIQGRLYMATDQTPPTMFYDTGSTWIQIGALAADSITAAQIAPDSIGTSELAPDSVTTAEILDGTIATGDLSDNSVTAPKINSALKPSTGAGGSTEALRALGTAAGLAAPGTHAAQHAAGGADPITITQAMLDPVTAGLLPQPGDIKWVAYNVVAGSEPTGWLLCDGRTSLSTTTYAALFAKLGYTHGGSGAAFGIPDMRGKAPIGIGQGTYAGATLRTIGQTGGEETHVTSVAEMPAHAHTITVNAETTDHTHALAGAGSGAVGVGNHQHPRFEDNTGTAPLGEIVDYNGPWTTASGLKWGTAGANVYEVDAASGVMDLGAGAHGHSLTGNTAGRSAAHTHTASAALTGSGNAHNNMQPWIALTPLIKT